MNYSAPSTWFIRHRTGINPYIEGLEDADLNARLKEMIPDGESDVALGVTEAFFDSSTLTSRQANALRRAVAFRVAADYLMNPRVQKATGTGRPLVTEPSEEMATLAAFLDSQADMIEENVTKGEATTAQDKPFALPAVGSSTFVGTPTLTPSEKLELLDERFDIIGVRPRV